MKRTLYFRGPDRSQAILGQRDAIVYVLHPDSPKQILEMPHKTTAEATATFAKVRKEYFNQYIGYHLTDERDTIDPDTWIFKWTPKEEAYHARVADARKGYMKDGERMAMSVYNVDFDAIFAAAGDVTWLHVLIGIEDNVDKHRRPVLMKLLEKGAAPQVRELIFESPWFTSLREIPLKLPAKLLERPSLQRLAAVGADAWPVAAKPKSLTHLRLETNLTPEMLASIANVRSLEVLQLAVNRKTEAAARELLIDRAFAELGISGLDDVVAMIEALLDAKQRPQLARLSGSIKKGTELLPAIERWQREADGAKLELGLWFPDDETRDAVAAAGMEATPSTFSSDYPPEHRQLIHPFQPSNYNGDWKA